MGLILAFIFLGAGALFMGAFLYFSAGLLFSWLAAAVRGANPEFTDKVFGPKERHIDITPENDWRDEL